MQRLHISIILLAMFCFVSCSKEAIVVPKENSIATLKGPANLELEILDDDLSSNDCTDGSCSNGNSSSQNQSKVGVVDTEIKLYISKKGFESGEAPIIQGSTDRSGYARFNDLSHASYYLHVTSAKGEFDRTIQTPKGKTSSFSIRL